MRKIEIIQGSRKSEEFEKNMDKEKTEKSIIKGVMKQVGSKKMDKNEIESIIEKEVIKRNSGAEEKKDIRLKFEKHLTFKSTIGHQEKVSYPMIKFFLDYFNIIDQDKKEQEKSGLRLMFFANSDGSFRTSLPLNMDSLSESYIVYLKIDKILFRIHLVRITIDGFTQHLVRITTRHKTTMDPDWVYDKIMSEAVRHSNLKGKYFTLDSKPLDWEIKILEKRTFNDLYLPIKIHSDIKMYTNLYDKSGKLLRYLFVGSPGSGKTESVLAISNDLNEKGVTIIKTKLCDDFDQKLRLAELLQPSLIILDDIDLSLGSRKRGMITPELSMFLDVMDGTDKIQGNIGFIAATNSLELLDLAAQRPGRFNRILSVNNLTRNNIKNIILKSLRANFDEKDYKNFIKAFVDIEVANIYFQYKNTGAYIFNMTNNIMLKVKALGMKEVETRWIINEIKEDVELLSTIRKSDYLTDNLQTSGTKVGFGKDVNGDDEEEYEYYEEEVIKKDEKGRKFI